ncbi:MAG TPA: hypothetical protein H9814_02740 [Candidatus Bacteroides merdigallinarum]|uniref:DUF4221 domain-containing protein n=1 Tax=Candidatus Bacteroides merdigallinarum TaxID=2838473 RepID=A0A9D2J1N0_9BACE|nr:hypothetical protein [Candidatus Bacteroides merdigallinarum]
MKKIHLLLGLMLLLSSCAKDYTQALSQLREELKQTNDTVYAYSMGNHYALWIHTDQPNTQTDGPSDGVYSLYYYDLETKTKEKLFTTGKDSLTLMPANEKHVVYNPVRLSFSEDSCALIIQDGTYVTSNFIALYPLVDSDRKTLYFLSNSELQDVRQAPNLYKGREYAELSYGDFQPYMQLRGADISWPPSSCWRNVYYNTKGKIDSCDTVYYAKYGNYAMREFKDIPIRASMLHNSAWLAQYVISTKAYTIDKLYQLYNNRIQFNQLFGKASDGEDSKQEYFVLDVLQVEETKMNNESFLLVKGDDFTIISQDLGFADLTYPTEVVIRATLTSMDSYREVFSNPYASYMFSLFGELDPGLISSLSKLEGDFVFRNGELLFYD